MAVLSKEEQELRKLAKAATEVSEAFAELNLTTQRKAAEHAAKTACDLTEKLQEELATLGMTAAAKRLYEAASKGCD